MSSQISNLSGVSIAFGQNQIFDFRKSFGKVRIYTYTYVCLQRIERSDLNRSDQIKKIIILVILIWFQINIWVSDLDLILDRF